MKYDAPDEAVLSLMKRILINEPFKRQDRLKALKRIAGGDFWFYALLSGSNSKFVCFPEAETAEECRDLAKKAGFDIENPVFEIDWPFIAGMWRIKEIA